MEGGEREREREGEREREDLVEHVSSHVLNTKLETWVVSSCIGLFHHVIRIGRRAILVYSWCTKVHVVYDLVCSIACQPTLKNSKMKLGRDTERK